MSARRVLVWLLCAAIVATACTADESEEVVADLAEGFQQLTVEHCAELALAADEGVPLDVIGVEDWPGRSGEDWGLPLVRVADPDALIEPFETAFIFDGSAAAAVPVPLHPSEDADGGVVELAFGQLDDEDGEFWCEQTHDLRIQPLADVEGDHGLRASLDVATQRFEFILEAFDITGPALAARDRDSLPAELIPLYPLAVLLYTEQGSLPEMVDDLSDAELAVADRLIGRVQRQAAAADPTDDGDLVYTLGTAREGPADTADDGGTADDEQPEAMHDHLLDARAMPATSRSTPQSTDHRQPLAPLQVTDPTDGGCTPTDIPGLTQLLGRQISGATMAGGGTGETIEVALFAAGLPVIGQVGLPTVITAWATKFTAQYLEGMLPSLWERTDLDYLPEVLWEDDVQGGQVDGVTMQFASAGWDSNPILAELGMIVADQLGSRAIRRGLGNRVNNPQAGTPGTIQIDGDVFWETAAAAESAGQQADVASEVLSWLATTQIGQSLQDDLARDDGRSIFSIDGLVYEPRCWEATSGASDLDDTLVLSYRDALEVGSASDRYLAIDRGVGTIEGQWDLPIGQEILGIGLGRSVRDAQASFGASGQVDVMPIRVQWRPSQHRVEPGDQVALDVRVDHAHDARIRLTDSLGLLSAEAEAGSGHSFTYVVPPDWDGTPIQITATSLSSDGLRATSHPAYRGEVAASAWLRRHEDPGLYLESSASCLEPGATAQLRVFDAPLGGQPVDVQWSTDRGSITDDGLLTAPSSDGEVTITAVATGDPDLRVQHSLTVGPCETCAYTVTVDGFLVGPEQVIAQGPNQGELSGIDLLDFDWNTGTFRGIEFGPVATLRAEGAPSPQPDAFQVPHLGIGQVVEWRPGDPPERPRGSSMGYRSMWEGRDPGNIVGWDPPAVNASIVQTGLSNDPDRPQVRVEGTVSGQVLVGRHLDTDPPGGSFFSAIDYRAEPIYGTITIEFEGLFYPTFRDAPNPDFDLFDAMEDPDSFDQEVFEREYDLVEPRETPELIAWCGGPRADHHARMRLSDRPQG